MAYPIPEDYVFEVGADPTSVFTTPEATLLLSFGRLMTTNEYYGIVIHSETTPATTGEPSGYPTDWYAWNKRCLWHKPSTNEIFGYQTGLGWSAAPVGDNTVDTDQIVDGAITLAKLAVTGTAFQILQINGAATAWTLVDPADMFTVGSIPISKLTAGGGGFVYSDGSTVFYQALNATLINAALPTATLAETALVTGAPLQILRTNSTASYTEWIAVTDAIETNSLVPAKLNPGSGNAGKVVQVAGDGLSVGYASLPATGAVITYTDSSALTVPTIGTTQTWLHGQTTAPNEVFAKLVCTVANNGYALGDYLKPEVVTVGAGGGAEGYNAFALAWNATTVTFIRTNAGPGSWAFPSKAGVSVAFVDTDWNVVFSSMKIA